MGERQAYVMGGQAVGERQAYVLGGRKGMGETQVWWEIVRELETGRVLWEISRCGGRQAGYGRQDGVVGDRQGLGDRHGLGDR